MSQPFSGLNIFITANGVSYLPQDLNLIKMEVTDSDEGDSEIELTCLDNNFTLIDSPAFKVGQLLSIKWGYVNSKASQARNNYVLMKPGVHYSKDGVEVTLKAYTKSATMAARQPRKVYGKTSVRQVISEIANRNGLVLSIKGGAEKLVSFSMANWTDRQTVRILADRYGYQASYTSDTLVFAPVDYGATPKFSLVYGQGEKGNILSATLNVDAHKNHGDAATTVTGVDPATKTVKTADGKDAQQTVAISAENGNAWLSTSQDLTGKPDVLSQIVPTLSVKELTANLPAGLADVIQHLTTPDTENVQQVATGEKLKKQKKKGELSITSIGMVDANCRKIVTVSGLAKRDSGNWYVQDAKHIITHQEGYVTEWELTRHGNNTKGGDPNKQPLNNQKAPNSPNVTVPVVVIDAETGLPVK